MKFSFDGTSGFGVEDRSDIKQLSNNDLDL